MDTRQDQPDPEPQPGNDHVVSINSTGDPEYFIGAEDIIGTYCDFKVFPSNTADRFFGFGITNLEPDTNPSLGSNGSQISVNFTSTYAPGSTMDNDRADENGQTTTAGSEFALDPSLAAGDIRVDETIFNFGRTAISPLATTELVLVIPCDPVSI